MIDVQSQLRMVNEAISMLSIAVEDIEEVISLKMEKLEALENNIESTNSNLDAAIENSKEECERLSDNEKEIIERIKPLAKEEGRLKTELGSLVTKKADLQVENHRLHEANTKFKAYEEGAWKVLKAKEAELLERESRVSQKEQLRPTSKTLLPPSQ